MAKAKILPQGIHSALRESHMGLLHLNYQECLLKCRFLGPSQCLMNQKLGGGPVTHISGQHPQ